MVKKERGVKEIIILSQNIEIKYPTRFWVSSFLSLMWKSDHKYLFGSLVFNL